MRRKGVCVRSEGVVIKIVSGWVNHPTCAHRCSGGGSLVWFMPSGHLRYKGSDECGVRTRISSRFLYTKKLTVTV